MQLPAARAMLRIAGDPADRARARRRRSLFWRTLVLAPDFGMRSISSPARSAWAATTGWAIRSSR